MLIDDYTHENVLYRHIMNSSIFFTVGGKGKTKPVVEAADNKG